MINFFTEDIKFPLAGTGVRSAIRKYLQTLIKNEGKKTGEINFIFCTDDYLLEINRQYLEHDYYTDVITFDNSDFPIVAGDIFISVDMVRTNAETYRVSFEQEMYRVIFHGVLHLCGYKDKTEADEKLMRQKEDEYLIVNNLS